MATKIFYTSLKIYILSPEQESPNYHINDILIYSFRQQKIETWPVIVHLTPRFSTRQVMEHAYKYATTFT